MLHIKSYFFSRLAKVLKLLNNNFIISAGILTILPFLIVSIFNNPSADDFNYNCKSRDFGFWNAQLDYYNTWSGRYIATAILCFRPLVSNSFFIYKLIPLLLFTSLYISIFYLVSLLFSRLKKNDILVCSFFVLITYLIQIPSVSQGFYWLSGSISYQLPNILSIILFYYLIKLLESNSMRYLLISLFLAVLIIGSNETSMFIIDYLLVVIFIFKYIQQKKVNYSLLTVLIFAVIFSLIVIKAPGNALRAKEFENNHQIPITIVKTILLAILYSLKWLPIILISATIYYKHFNTNVKNESIKIFDLNPMYVFIIICFIPLVGFLPGIWSMGYRPPPRTINVIYFYFLFGMIYLAFVAFFKIKKINEIYSNFSKWNSCLLLSIVAGFIGIDNNIKTVYSDLISGSAYGYNIELKNRYRLIQDNKKDTCYVPKLINKPTTIFFEDITTEPDDWKNGSYSSYFKKEVIILEK